MELSRVWGVGTLFPRFLHFLHFLLSHQYSRYDTANALGNCSLRCSFVRYPRFLGRFQGSEDSEIPGCSMVALGSVLGRR